MQLLRLLFENMLECDLQETGDWSRLWSRSGQARVKALRWSFRGASERGSEYGGSGVGTQRNSNFVCGGEEFLRSLIPRRMFWVAIERRKGGRRRR